MASPIILFHYPSSPFSARVLYYLALRGIPYDQCRLEHLDGQASHHHHHPPFAAQTTPAQRALEHLLASFTLETDLFKRIVQVILPNTPLVHNDAFMKDRVEMIGGPPDFNFVDFLLPTRPDAINEVKDVIEFLETTPLADGREWLANTDAPSRADIETVWPLHWLLLTPGAIPEEFISRELFPRVFAWVDRFVAAVGVAQSALREPETLSGEQVAERLGRLAAEEETGNGDGDVVDESDPLVRAHGLQKGQVVEVWPSDTGFTRKTVGRLLGLNRREITIETTEGDVSVRVHAPRHGFQVAAVSGKASKLS